MNIVILSHNVIVTKFSIVYTVTSVYDEVIEKTIPIDQKIFPPLALLSFLTLPPRECVFGHLPHSFSVHEKTRK